MRKVWMICLALTVLLAGCGKEEGMPGESGENPVKEEVIAVPDTERPGSTRFIVDIIDLTQEEGISTDAALELFYEDEAYEYYFPSIKSEYIIVGYNNSGTENVVDALQNERVTLENLNYFGIEYIKVPKEAE